MKHRGIWLLFGSVICGAVSLISAFDALSNVRLVITITILAGAFGSGASLVSAIYNFKQSKGITEN